MTVRMLVAALVTLAAAPVFANDAPRFAGDWYGYGEAMSDEPVTDAADVSMSRRDQFAVMTADRARAERADTQASKRHDELAMREPASAGGARGCSCALNQRQPE